MNYQHTTSKFFRCAWFAGVLFLGLSQAASGAGQVVVDLFTQVQVAADVVNGGGGDTQSTATGIASILGGQRDINANALSGTTDMNTNTVCDVGDKCATISISGGSLRLNVDTGVIGTGIVQWDGDDQSIALVEDGLGGIDLTNGGLATGVDLEISESDQSFIFSVEAYTDANNFTKFEIQSTAVMAGMPITRFIPFSVFENPAFCGDPGATGDPQILAVHCGPGNQTADFTNLGALQVRLNLPDEFSNRTVALDMVIREIAGPLDEPPLACRLTGGGVSTSDVYLDTGEMVTVAEWDGKTFAEAEANLNGTTTTLRYQFGGQAGARTALPLQPWGEWTHHQQDPFDFTFHAGTRSAPNGNSPPGTEIVEIRCSDPGGCGPSGNPPSPAKQIDFDCVGTFKNLGHGKNAPVWLIADATVTAEGNGNKTFDGTYHRCEVNVDDNGEGPDPAEGDSAACPPDGFGEKAVTADANCDCPDFYRITIYDGVYAEPDGSVDPAKLNAVTDVIYQVQGYLGRGGNGLQIHDLTGFDRR